MTSSNNSKLLWILLATAAAIGCDDAAGGPSGGDGGGGTGGGDVGGGGDTSDAMLPDSGPLQSCLSDGQCADGQYCDVPSGALEGVCRPGCRGEGDCEDGQICQDHQCVDEPCAGDDACPDGQYCSDGACTDGCRVVEGSCAELIEGRTATCDPATHTCIPLFVCCSGDDGQACGLTPRESCTGDVLESALDCSAAPCGAVCTANDTCENNQYCDPVDGRCREGCRSNDDCGPNEICDPDKHSCERVRCDGDGQCPDDQYCDASGFCADGCRDDESCLDGERCNTDTHVCEAFCESDNQCAQGYCDEIRNVCRDFCDGHDACDPGEYCDPGTEECVRGCRDDAAEPNGDTSTAAPVELGAFVDGVSRASIQGARLCNTDSDFYQVDLDLAQRLQIVLNYNPVQGNLDLRLHGTEVGETPIEVTGLEVPAVIRFPGLNDTRNAATYYVEVLGEGGETGIDYQLDFTVVDAINPCFPDARDPGDDQWYDGHASPIADNDPSVLGQICSDDEDWFTFPLHINDGLLVELIATAESDGAILELYSESRLEQALGGGPSNPNIRVDEGERSPTGSVIYRFDQADQSGAFSNESWYMRVRGANRSALVEYELALTFRRDGSSCENDAFEENNGLEAATDLASIPGLVSGGLLVEDQDLLVSDDLAMCSGDEDLFALEAEGGEILTAWVVSNGIVGSVNVQFLDSAGNPVGRQGLHTAPGAAIDPARLPGAATDLYYIRVDGQGAAQGPYSLYVRRSIPTVAVCGEDFTETEQGAIRNDTPANATLMDDITGQGTRYEFMDGVVCDAGSSDQDWYSFDVPQPGSRLCVTVDGFNVAAADIDLELFRPGQDPNALPCVQNRDCGADGGECGPNGRCLPRACVNDAVCGGGVCVDGRCAATIAFSTTDYGAEAIDLPRDVVGEYNGEHLIRVRRGADGASTPYRVIATVTPGSDVCAPDWAENETPNDDQAQPTRLFEGQVAMCDTWLCNNDSGADDQDWYELTIPANEDRTIIIEYQNGVDGRARLEAFDKTCDDAGGEITDCIRRSRVSEGNHQCINVVGGELPRELLVNVKSDLFVNNSARVDYSLRVVATDLSTRPLGECLTLGAIGLPACDPDEAQSSTCWLSFPPYSGN